MSSPSCRHWQCLRPDGAVPHTEQCLDEADLAFCTDAQQLSVYLPALCTGDRLESDLQLDHGGSSGIDVLTCKQYIA